MGKSRLDPQQELLLYYRVLSGESRLSIARELGLGESTVRRIFNKGLDVLVEKAGGVKPRVRVKAGKIVLTDPVPQEKVGGEIKEDPPLRIGSGIMTFNPTNPLGESVEPTGLVRRLGTRVQVTQHGTTIVTDSSGKAVKVERCPVQRRIGLTSSFQDVDITEIDGVKVRGKYQQWSGEVIEGTLIFDGQGANGSRRITSVVFFPDDAEEAKGMAEILRDKPKVA